jgi:putative transposase
VSPFALVHADAAAGTAPVSVICSLLGVSRSGYNAWCRRPRSARARSEERLVTKMKAIETEVRGTYGSPRMHKELVEGGERVSRGRIERIMRDNGIRARRPRRFRATTDSNHRLPVAPNILDRKFDPDEVNRAWVGDITYVWTAEGWAYVAVLLDLYSRKVVGWALKATLSRELALAALRKALLTRRPAPGLVHHTDRGSQYASREYRALLQEHEAVQSMSRAGDCFDNAVAESFFASLKKERLDQLVLATRTEAHDAVHDYIENFYNPRRRHSANGFRSPVAFEQPGRDQAAAAA